MEKLVKKHLKCHVFVTFKNFGDYWIIDVQKSKFYK